MAYGPISRRVVAFDGSSARSSTYTSNAICVSDFAQMSFSWHSSGPSSRLTVWATNEDGFRTSITTWSAISGVVAQGAYAIEPGPRWVRFTRQSADSLSQVFLNGRT